MLSSRHLCLAALLLGLSSCTYLEKKLGGISMSKGPKDKRVGPAKVIGVIEMVNPEQNYVLINCEHRVDIPAGSEIISQGVNGTDARLKVSPERKGNYITADIVQGTPQLRDLVVYQIPAEDSGGASPPPPVATPAGSIAPMTPIMQADVIPPLDTPFQPMTPVKPAAETAPPPLRQQPPQMPLPPASAPAPKKEPAADLSKLPPVIR